MSTINENTHLLSSSNKESKITINGDTHLDHHSHNNNNNNTITNTLTKFLLNYRSMFTNIRGNLSAGLSVALINVPLSISLSVAAQSDPVSGIITAVWAGIISSLTGGSKYNIFGPTGALSGILARYVARYGPAVLPILALFSAGWALFVYIFQLQSYLLFLPSSVMHGFSLGVAIIIGMGQMNSAFALTINAPPHEVTVLNWWESFKAIGTADIRIFMIFFALWILLFGLIKYKRSIPWSVLIACMGIIIGLLSSNGYFFHIPTLKDKFHDLSPKLSNIPDFITIFSSMTFPQFVDMAIASLSIAFVSVLESLISGKIADGMTKSSSPSEIMNERQEVFGAAATNIAVGLFGGIPATAALARTALNVRSGATTNLAGLFSALLTAIIAMVLMPLFGYLPLCVVATLLFQVAVGMIEFDHLIHSYHLDSFSFYLTLIVGAVCVIFDPTSGLIVGAIIGLLRYAKKSSTGFAEVLIDQKQIRWSRAASLINESDHNERNGLGLGGEENTSADLLNHEQYDNGQFKTPGETEEKNIAFYRIVGDFTYISAYTHHARLSGLFNHRVLLLSLRYVNFIDFDGLEALGEIIESAHQKQCLVLLSSIPLSISPLLSKASWFIDYEKKGRVFSNGKEALEYAKQHMEQWLKKSNDSIQPSPMIQ